MVKNWIKDLVIIKTFIGLKFQEAILSKTATIFHTSYKLSTREDESRGIEGYVGNVPVSIKPETYKTKMNLSEKIDARFIFYRKAKDGLIINVEDLL